MLVSVIIPTFNRAHLLARAIESVLNQSYKHIEIVIVDDGSNDTTRDVVMEVSRSAHIPIKYFKKKNGGCASARNKGLEIAAGGLFIFLDSDDALEPRALESLTSRLVESGADLVYSPSVEILRLGSESIAYPVAAERPQEFATEHFLATNVRTGAYIFTRSALDKVGGFDESLTHNEDSDFVQRLAIHCRAQYSSTPSVRVYHHGSNKSGNRVEIYRALLRSSENVLAEYPSFAMQLGSNADRRITQIKIKLAEALVCAGKTNEAIQISSPIKKSLSKSMRFALVMRSPYPLKIGKILGSSVRIIASLIGWRSCKPIT